MSRATHIRIGSRQFKVLDVIEDRWKYKWRIIVKFVGDRDLTRRIGASGAVINAATPAYLVFPDSILYIIAEQVFVRQDWDHTMTIDYLVQSVEMHDLAWHMLQD